MKVFLINDDDLNNLILAIDRNPQHGHNGGSSRGTPTKDKLMIENEAHSFFNHQVRKWINGISSGERKIR